MKTYYDVFETSFGWVGLLASGSGLMRSTLPEPSPEECVSELGPQAEQAAPSPERFGALRDKLTGYFEGERMTFDDEAVDVDDASPFHRAAWDACRRIPLGETRTYKWLAAQAGKPQAPRAAGQSMARNRLPIIVPCHRVIGSDGSLRGFGAGAGAGSTRLALKQRLLDMEARHRQGRI